MEQVVMTLIPSVSVAGNRKGEMFGFPVQTEIEIKKKEDQVSDSDKIGFRKFYLLTTWR